MLHNFRQKNGPEMTIDPLEHPLRQGFQNNHDCHQHRVLPMFCNIVEVITSDSNSGANGCHDFCEPKRNSNQHLKDVAGKFRLLITLCNADTKQNNDSTLNQQWQQHHHTDSNHSLPTHMGPSSLWNKSKFNQNFHKDQHNIWTDGSQSKGNNMQTFQDQIL